MPFQRRNYRRRTYAKKRYVPKPVKSYVRTQVARAERKESPLMYADFKFTGDSVSTDPTAYSLLHKFIEDCGLNTVEAWPVQVIDGEVWKKARIKIESVHYQLRYQNDTTDLYSTFRHLLYVSETGVDNTQATAPSPILDDADVDSPPDTSTLISMYADNIRYVRDLQADEDSEAPGTAILKATKRIGHIFNVDYQATSSGPVWFVDSKNLLLELQSNSSTAPHPSMYGFVRIYGRIMY